MTKYSSKDVREMMFCPVHRTMMPIDPVTGKRKCAVCSGEVKKAPKEVPAEIIGSSNTKRLKSASRRIKEEQDKSDEGDANDEGLDASSKPAYLNNDSLLPLYLIDGRFIRRKTNKEIATYLEVSCERGFKFFANALDLDRKNYSIERVVDNLCDMCHKRECTFTLSEKEMGKYFLQMREYNKNCNK